MIKVSLLVAFVFNVFVPLHSQTWSGATPGNIYYNGGNVGIGNSNPGARLSFDDVFSEEPIGMTWYSPSPLDYAIFKTPGSWTAPSFQQLKVNWSTGIILNPGSVFNKCFVDVQGNGLRVSSGNVGIGTLIPSSKMEVVGDLKVVTNPVLGTNGLFQVKESGVQRPGALELILNSASILSFDRRLNFFDGNGSTFTISDYGRAGTSTKRGYIVGSSPDNAGANDSYLHMGVTNENEFTQGGGYPSGQNSYRLYTGLNSPVTSVNTGQLAERAPLCVDARYLSFNVGATSWEAMRLSLAGNLTVGSATDNGNKVQVNGNLWTTGLILPTGASAGKVLTSDATGNATWQAAGGGSNSWSLSGSNMYNANAGVVVIGTVPVILPSDQDLKLAVNGNIYTKKLKVTQSGWADYVFAPSYKLRPLKEVEQFIKENQRLPEMPSAENVKNNGVDVGDNQVLLLKKIEELTLYIIELEKKMEAVNNKLEGRQKSSSHIKNNH